MLGRWFARTGRRDEVFLATKGSAWVAEPEAARAGRFSDDEKYAGAGVAGATAVTMAAVTVFSGLGVLAAVLAGLWLRSATTAGDPVRAALHGAALASAALIALAPSFHPWYVVFPLVLLGATTARTDLVMAAGAAAAFLVLPDGGGLARFAKFTGAPLMTILLVGLIVHRSSASPSETRRRLTFRHRPQQSVPVGAGTAALPVDSSGLHR